MDIKHATDTIENRGDNPPKEEFTSPKFDMNVTLEENNINVEAFSLDTDTSQIRNYRRRLELFYVSFMFKLNFAHTALNVFAYESCFNILIHKFL